MEAEGFTKMLVMLSDYTALFPEDGNLEQVYQFGTV
jgi:hypothetical protein